MSFAVVLEGMTLIAYVVIMLGGKQKREQGWKVLSACLLAVGAVQCAGMGIIVSADVCLLSEWRGLALRCCCPAPGGGGGGVGFAGFGSGWWGAGGGKASCGIESEDWADRAVCGCGSRRTCTTTMTASSPAGASTRRGSCARSAGASWFCWRRASSLPLC